MVIRWRFPDGRKYAFAFIALFVFLIIIYASRGKGIREEGKRVKSPFDLCLTIRGMEERYVLIPMDAFYESIKLKKIVEI